MQPSVEHSPEGRADGFQRAFARHARVDKRKQDHRRQVLREAGVVERAAPPRGGVDPKRNVHRLSGADAARFLLSNIGDGLPGQRRSGNAPRKPKDMPTPATAARVYGQLIPVGVNALEVHVAAEHGRTTKRTEPPPATYQRGVLFPGRSLADTLGALLEGAIEDDGRAELGRVFRELRLHRDGPYADLRVNILGADGQVEGVHEDRYGPPADDQGRSLMAPWHIEPPQGPFFVGMLTLTVGAMLAAAEALAATRRAGPAPVRPQSEPDRPAKAERPPKPAKKLAPRSPQEDLTEVERELEALRAARRAERDEEAA